MFSTSLYSSSDLDYYTEKKNKKITLNSSVINCDNHWIVSTITDGQCNDNDCDEILKMDVCKWQLSLCNEPLRELSNPGASGSIFYITDDDDFIIKTVQRKEAEFLQKLLPGYYMVSMEHASQCLAVYDGLTENSNAENAKKIKLNFVKSQPGI